jgi:flagellar hook-basal body complex protein FliE
MRIDAITSPLNDAALSRVTDAEQTAAPLAPNALPGTQETEAGSKPFGQFLQEAIGEVDQAQSKAGDLTARFAAGEPVDIHQVEIAGQEANVMLSLTMQVRNKLMDAYTEITHVNV